MAFDRHYWHAQQVVTDALRQRFSKVFREDSRVVDVGAGYCPWPCATELVDSGNWKELDVNRCHKIDVEVDSLPFQDRSVDFIYCRHTLEDLCHPGLICREMSRVARAGYIETPSPLAEICRGIDGGGVLRGYVHHHWFVWVQEDTLMFLPKQPVIEHLTLSGTGDQDVLATLCRNPGLWNTYYPWEGELNFRILQHPRDFNYRESYVSMLVNAIEVGMVSSRSFLENFGIDESKFSTELPNQNQ